MDRQPRPNTRIPLTTRPSNAALPPIRILVVEENWHVLHALIRLLATEPAVQVVGSVASPDDAVIQAARLEPDLVLIDWSLPRPAAAQACWLMRVRPSPPKIVALLNDDAESYRLSAGSAGADAVIAKARLSEELPGLMKALFPARPAEK